jgi:hypothetical protein
MIEPQGWARIKAPHDSMNAVVGNITEKNNETEPFWGFTRLDYCSGEPFISANLIRNHIGVQVYAFLSLFSYIGEVPGDACGLVYMVDDEDVAGQRNNFQVFVLSSQAGIRACHRNVQRVPMGEIRLRFWLCGEKQHI